MMIGVKLGNQRQHTDNQPKKRETAPGSQMTAYPPKPHTSKQYLDDNYLFAAIIATQNDKMAQAIDAFDEIINNMPESEAAFKLAKEAVLTICGPRVRSRTKCSGNTSPTKIWA